jgi:hypothetical protein
LPKLAIWVALLALLLYSFPALGSPQEEALTAAVYKVITVRAQAGLRPGNESRLDPLYDLRPSGEMCGPRLLQWEKARARNLQAWQAKAGVSIQDAGVAVVLRDVLIAGERASVRVREHLRLRWQYQGHSGQNLTQMVYDHEMEFWRVRGHWLLRKDAYVDTLFQAHLGADHETPRHSPGGQQAGGGLGKRWWGAPTAAHTAERGAEGGYDPLRAVAYASHWWDGFNPRYRTLGDDCTNFISQVLGDAEGGAAPQRPGNYHLSWYYDYQQGLGSRPWVNADGLQRFLVEPLAGLPYAYGEVAAEGSFPEVLQAVKRLRPGDLIAYAWPNNQGHNDLVFDHATVVTGLDSSGAPLVTAHTHPVFNAPWHLNHLVDATHFKLIRMRQRFPLP